jgi:microcystin-dependent protein
MPALMSKKTRLFSLLGLLLAAGGLVAPDSAHAAVDPFIGEVSCGGWTYCPMNWIECDGQILPIASYTELFSAISTTYGGDGQTTFAVPNLSGRSMIGTGQGAGLSNRTQGEAGGTENVTLTPAQLPGHTHALNAQTATGDSSSPRDRVAASVAADDARYSSTANGTLSASALGTAGSNLPHNNLQPYQVLKCCIATTGTYPSP